MILTACFDESGTHGGSGVAVMAGHVGNMRQWRQCGRRVNRLFEHYNVDLFHSTDVRHSDKAFKGWKVDTKIEFLDELAHIINETLEFSVASVLRQEDYDYYCKLDWPKGTRKDTQYALLFRGCAAAVIDRVMQIPKWRRQTEPRLKFVLEGGHQHKGDAQRLYADFQKRFGPSRALSGLSFEGKQGSLPLACADLFAYSAWGQEVGQRPIGTPRKPTKADKSYRQNAFRVPLVKDSLLSLNELARGELKPEQQ